MTTPLPDMTPAVNPWSARNFKIAFAITFPATTLSTAPPRGSCSVDVGSGKSLKNSGCFSIYLLDKFCNILPVTAQTINILTSLRDKNIFRVSKSISKLYLILF